MAAKKEPLDEGEQQIDDLEHKLVLGKIQLWQWSGVSEEEITLLKPALAQLAKTVCDQLRREYRARTQP